MRTLCLPYRYANRYADKNIGGMYQIAKFNELSSDNDSSNRNGGIENKRMDNNKKFQLQQSM